MCHLVPMHDLSPLHTWRRLRRSLHIRLSGCNDARSRQPSHRWRSEPRPLNHTDGAGALRSGCCTLTYKLCSRQAEWTPGCGHVGQRRVRRVRPQRAADHKFWPMTVREGSYRGCRTAAELACDPDLRQARDGNLASLVHMMTEHGAHRALDQHRLCLGSHRPCML